MNVETRKCLSLSTGHVSDETRRLLDETPLADWPVFGFKGLFGWVIFAHDEDYLEIPDDLRGVCNYARQNNCEYIMFDADADVLDDLPFFEW